jgi:hypothetical protein
LEWLKTWATLLLPALLSDIAVKPSGGLYIGIGLGIAGFAWAASPTRLEELTFAILTRTL